VARNRQRAKERQARRKAQRQSSGPGAVDAKAVDPKGVDGKTVDPNGADLATPPPPLSESERLRAGAPPEDVGFSAEALDYEQDLEAEHDGHHFDPSQDIPEEDLTEDGEKRRRPVGEHKHRPRLVQFLVAVWAELQRVQWPDRQALTTLTGVVLGFVLIAGGYLGLLDAIASRLIQAIL
jgi:preprotein translocase SecE subunit